MPRINYVFATQLFAASFIAGSSIGGGQVALAGAPDVMTLPFAEVRTGNDIGRTWSGVDDLIIPASNPSVIAHFPGGVAVGASNSDSPFAPVAIWTSPVPGDPLARYGMRQAQFLTATVVPDGSLTAGSFGAALAADAQWLFVGAPASTHGTLDSSGAVYVFHRSTADEPWTAFDVLTNPYPESSARFGSSVAFDGSTLVVGVPGRHLQSDAPATGGADLYDITRNGIGAPRTFVAPINDAGPLDLGRRVAVDGSRFAISGPASVTTIPSGIVYIVSTARDLAIEATLTHPSGQLETAFGDGLSLDAGRLAVGAPSEDVPGASNVGAVRIYSSRGGVWTLQHTLTGVSSSASLGPVALDGDFLAVGAPGTYTGGNPTLKGRAALYRLDASGLTLLANADALAGAPGAPHRWNQGGQVAVGDGRWSFREKVGTSLFGIQSVRSLPLTAALSDCDGDGVTDLAAVLQGAPDRDANGVPDDCIGRGTLDCDNDGIADSSSTLLGPAIAPPVPDSAWWGVVGPEDAHRAAMAIVPLEVPAGTDGMLRGVEADWSVETPFGANYAQPVFVAVYEDPGQTGNPFGLVLRGAWRAVVNAAQGIDRVFLPEPIALGPPGTKYFIGVGGIALAGADAPMGVRHLPAVSAQPPYTWSTHGLAFLATDLDLAQPAGNVSFQALAGTVACVGLFNSPIDVDGNAVPDVCACAADFDGDGAVTAGDLAALLGAWGASGATDLDHDGVVGAGDVALLLGMWGPCD